MDFILQRKWRNISRNPCHMLAFVIYDLYQSLQIDIGFQQLIWKFIEKLDGNKLNWNGRLVKCFFWLWHLFLKFIGIFVFFLMISSLDLKLQSLEIFLPGTNLLFTVYFFNDKWSIISCCCSNYSSFMFGSWNIWNNADIEDMLYKGTRVR